VADLPATRPSLLVRLRDPHDADAWRQFVQVYGPAVYGYARKRGLQDADAADVMQEVLRSVMKAIGRLEYGTRQVSFRAWLFTLAHHRVCDFLARRTSPAQGTGDTAMIDLLEQQPAPAEDTELWDDECSHTRFAWAAERVRACVPATSWQAFWQTAVEGARAKEVAQRLGITVTMVYLAKSRVMARIKEQLEECEPD
jgi:RNA polymerase sigma factor (sigma-70 family)